MVEGLLVRLGDYSALASVLMKSSLRMVLRSCSSSTRRIWESSLRYSGWLEILEMRVDSLALMVGAGGLFLRSSSSC